jgi:hypothetical protein
MGKPGTSDVVSPVTEYIGGGGERGEVKHLSTRRKRKQISDSVSSGERKRKRLNRMRVIAGRRCVCGVVGPSGRGCRFSKQ